MSNSPTKVPLKLPDGNMLWVNDHVVIVRLIAASKHNDETNNQPIAVCEYYNTANMAEGQSLTLVDGRDDRTEAVVSSNDVVELAATFEEVIAPLEQKYKVKYDSELVLLLDGPNLMNEGAAEKFISDNRLD